MLEPLLVQEWHLRGGGRSWNGVVAEDADEQDQKENTKHHTTKLLYKQTRGVAPCWSVGNEQV